MPDLTLSDAIKEAYAAADSSAPLIDTLSLYYAGLVDDGGHPTELYLFTGANATSFRDDGVPLLSAKIEASAPRNGGAVVLFLGVPFEITLPNVTEDPQVSAQIRLDNIGREISDLCTAAAQSGNAVYLTYRPYLAGAELDGPEADPPMTFILKNVKAPGQVVTADLVTQTIGNRRFPNRTYTPTSFKTLQYA